MLIPLTLKSEALGRHRCTTFLPLGCLSRGTPRAVDKVDQLLERAERFRKIAQTMTDQRTRAALIDLAAEYEAEAQTLLEQQLNGEVWHSE
jgi:hypothetical protein